MENTYACLRRKNKEKPAKKLKKLRENIFLQYNHSGSASDKVNFHIFHSHCGAKT